MMARWFVTDQSEMGKYRLKKHGIKDFWSWVASWARSIGKPSDVGYSDDGYVLPKMQTELHIVQTDLTAGADEGQMFRSIDLSATSVHKEKRITSHARAARIAEVVKGEPNEQWVIWCETDYDADAIMALLPEAVEVRGSMKPEVKEQRLMAFTDGIIKILVTKASIAGFGLNWQNCARTAFVGLSFSYEQYYQAIRRFYRFGQKREVHCHIAIADTELPIWKIVERKALEHETMKREMNEAMKREVITREVKVDYNPTIELKLPSFLGV
jgi:superfamily II DNA/RNA helicase